jgi:hypothetical protein
MNAFGGPQSDFRRSPLLVATESPRKTLTEKTIQLCVQSTRHVLQVERGRLCQIQTFEFSLGAFHFAQLGHPSTAERGGAHPYYQRPHIVKSELIVRKSLTVNCALTVKFYLSQIVGFRSL